MQHQEPPAGTDLLIYLRRHRALVCREHKYAVTLNQLGRHLGEKHGLPLARRAPIVHYFSVHAADATSPENINYEGLIGLPKPLELVDLGTPKKGFACQECGALTADLSHIQTHLVQVHGVRSRKGPRSLTTTLHWREVYMQTFFQAKKDKRFFEVSLRPAQESPAHAPAMTPLKRLVDEAWAASEESRLAPARPSVIDADVHRSLTRPWLRRTQWREHLDGVDPASILSAASWVKPRAEETDMLAFIGKAAEAMLRDCLESRRSVSEIALRHLQNFSGLSDGRLNTQPFSAKQEAATHTRYMHTWIRLIFFVVRISQGWLDFAYLDRPLFVLTAGQTSALEEVLHLASLGEFLDDALNRLKRALLILSYNLLSHNLEGNQFESAIVSYNAARGLSETSGAWLEPGSITQFLVAMVWCSQLVVLGYSVRLVRELGSPLGLTDTIADASHQWLTNTRSTPVMYMLTLQLYLRKAAASTPAPAKVYWADGGSMIYFEDFSMTMSELKSFVSSLLAKAESVMREDLLFCGDNDTSFLAEILPAAQIGLLKESITTSNLGYSFLDVPLNNLSGLARLALDRVNNSPSLFSHFLSQDDSGLHVQKKSPQAYRKKVSHFLELLAVLMYLTGGSPPRASELVGLRWLNNELRRDVFLHNGMAMFVTTYNKTQSMMDASKTIPRFMPLRLTRLYILFLAAVKPFLRFLYTLEFGVGSVGTHSFAGSFFLFSSGSGTPVASTTIGNCLERESLLFLGRKIKVSSWRHISKAIIRQHLRSASKPVLDDSSSSDDDDVQDDGALWAAQYGHSVRTGAMVYGRELNLGNDLVWENIHHYRRISSDFHTFLDIVDDYVLPPHVPASFGTAALPLAAFRSPVDFSTALTKMYGEGASFASAVQQDASVEVVEKGTKELVVVLPTGGGKSWFFVLGCFFDKAALVTLVVVPLRALLLDIGRRLHDRSLAYEVWSTESSGFTERIVLVSADLVSSQRFRTQLTSLYLNGQLGRIVYDECHLVLTQGHFRESLRLLVNLQRLADLQHVFLSATLPPRLEAEFRQLLTLRNPVVKRASTRRVNIAYSVRVCQDVSEVDQELLGLVTARTDAGESVLVFCRTRSDVVYFASLLKCGGFYSGHPDGERNLVDWLDGSGLSLVATGALGLGVDKATVGLVVHVNLPYGLIDFAQESGRAGRQNKPASSVILTSRPWESRRGKSLPTEHLSWTLSEREMDSFMVTSDCRRLILDNFLDGSSLGPCGASPGPEENCDVCTEALNNLEADLAVDEAEPVLEVADVSEPVSLGVLSLRNIEHTRRYDHLRRIILPTYIDVCTFCHFHGRPSDGHTSSSCPAFPSFRFAFGAASRLIRYERYTACFSCGLPQSLCSRFGPDGLTQQPCQHKGLVVAFLAICHTSPSLLSRLAIWIGDDELNGCSLEAFTKWSEKEAFVMGLKCCRGFDVMLRLLEHNVE